MDLIINPKTSSPAIPQLNLERTVVQRELRIENAKVDVLKASHLQVKGPATFENLTIKQSVDLRDSTFQTLNLIKSTWPKDEEKVWLEGLTYNAINAGPGKEDWKKLLAWVEGSRFNTQVYSQLENYFQRCGHRERANKVFVSGERRGWLKSWSWRFWRWPWNILKLIFWDCGVRYGRSPIRALFYSTLFVLLGTWIFSKPGILTWDKCKPGEIIWVSKAFWYSLDLFLPVISLGPDKFYQVNPEALIKIHDLCILAQTYSYLHQLAGYILVSIGVAAIISLAGSK